MTLRIFIENLAEADLEEHIDYIAADSPLQAARFIEAVQSSFARLADMPRIGKVREFRNDRLTGIRFWPIPGFVKILIFFRVTGNEVLPTVYRRSASQPPPRSMDSVVVKFQPREHDRPYVPACRFLDIILYII